MMKRLSAIFIFYFLSVSFAIAAAPSDDVRVFQHPDGSISIMQLNPRYRGVVTLDGETAKNKSLKDLPFVDVQKAVIPKDRTNRHKWRLQGKAVIVDNTVPDIMKGSSP